MTIEHFLAVVPVADIDTARNWYERLLGRAPDNRPMETLVEWTVTDTGWLQVFNDADRAGSAMLNFAVDDLATHLAGLRSTDLAPGPIENVNKEVQLSSITDPDGNIITFIGNFRVNY
jgi:catechol 2,3-dioxygenase-like lactoylglutathione lyase family enzyme